MNPKSLLYLSGTLLAAVVFSCGNVEPTDEPKNRPVNYIVLLDLSDRLLQPGQPANDQALIATVFAQFRKTVYEKNLVIKSRDKFRVVIAPQAGVAYNPDGYMSKLYLDMASLSVGDKNKQAKEFENAMPTTLASLYAGATRGKTQPSHYAGCDLWKYFNEQLASDLVAGADNRLVVLTDGYFDFQKNLNVITTGHRSTSTDFLVRLRNSTNWQQTMQQQDWGLLPAKVNLPDVRVSVVEINPKSGSLNEAPLLKAIWQKWLGEMHVVSSVFIQKYSLSNSMAKLRESLESN
jgi:hypothetical protein